MSSVALGPRICTPRIFRSGATISFSTPLSAPRMSPRPLSHERLADDVIGSPLAQVLLGCADVAQLRNRVDAVRKDRGEAALAREPEAMHDGQPALLHAGRCKPGEPDHVAGGVDVGDGGAELRVHRDVAALVGDDADRGEVQVLDIAAPSRAGDEGLRAVRAT